MNESVVQLVTKDAARMTHFESVFGAVESVARAVHGAEAATRDELARLEVGGAPAGERQLVSHPLLVRPSSPIVLR